MTAVVERTTAHATRRQRALDLAARYEYAAEPLRLCAALAGAQERVFLLARERPPSASALVAFVVREALPAILDATMAAGTETLREAALLRFHRGDLEAIVAAWLAGDALEPTDAYLARAAASPVLEAVPEVAVRPADAADERRCPACGGLPQLSIFTDTGEALATGQRRLLCARCATEWTYPRMVCPSCRESGGARLPILSDEERLSHLRVDACDVCHAYLVTVDLRREPRAVPVVDEIVALPLMLAAAERGYTKITPNGMGL